MLRTLLKEDGVLVESEERSVDNTYVSTEANASMTYSPSNKLQA